MQSAVYISDTSVTLKQSKGPQTLNDNVDHKQGYNHASLKDFAKMVFKKKPTLIFSKEKTCQLSPLNLCNNKK